MSINTPEIASLFGALDSNAFGDGQPFSAHLLRTLMMSSNRLASKGHEMLNLIWPVAVAPSYDASIFGHSYHTLDTAWTRLAGPITVPKKPGLKTGTFSITAKIENSFEALVQVVTKEKPFSANARAGDAGCMLFSGDGDNDFDTDSMTGIPLDRQSDTERIEIWIKHAGASGAADTATCGSPSSGQAESIGPDGFAADTATFSWTVSSPGTWGEQGHVVRFLDAAAGSGGVPITRNFGMGRITESTLTTQYLVPLRPRPTQREIDAAIDADLYFEIVKLGRIAISNLALFADGRTV